MITKYKLFESRHIDNIKDELVEQLDQDYIENFYDENYNISVEEIIEVWPDVVFKHVNDSNFLENFIDEEKQSRSLDDFGEYEYKKFIEENMDDEKETKILQLYNDKNYTEDDEKETEYESHMLDDLDEDELREVIEDANEEEDCVEDVVDGWYSGYSVEDIIKEFYGRMSGREMYNTFGRYIDDDAIVQEWKDNDDYDTKKDFIKDRIWNEKDIQEKLLKLDPKNVLLLYDVFKEDGGNNNISDEYEFQKIYIEQYLISNDYDEEDDEGKSYIRAKALKNLYDNFGLDSDIESEHEEDMWMVHAKKYNL